MGGTAFPRVLGVSAAQGASWGLPLSPSHHRAMVGVQGWERLCLPHGTPDPPDVRIHCFVSGDGQSVLCRTLQPMQGERKPSRPSATGMVSSLLPFPSRADGDADHPLAPQGNQKGQGFILPS